MRSKNSLSQLIHYIKIFQKYLGPRIYIVTILSLVAALSEGIGFLIVLPLFEVLGTSEEQEMTGVGELLFNFFTYLGWDGSPIILIIAITITFLLKGLLVFGSMGFNAYLIAKLLRELKERLFDRYSVMDYRYYASRDTGHFTNVMNNQINTMLIAFRSMMRLGSEFVMGAVYVGLAFTVAWKFGVMAIIFGVLLLLVFRSLNVFVRSLSRKTATESGILSKLLIQYLHAYKYLTSTSQSSHLRKKFFESVDRFVDYELKRRVSETLTFSLREPILVVAVMIIIGTQIGYFNEPIAPILVSIALFYRGLNSFHGMQLYGQLMLDQIGSVEMVNDEFDRQDENVEYNGDYVIGDFSKEVVFQNISFSYGKEFNNAVAGINLSIPAFSSIAVIGSSGAGKSTIIDLLTLILRPTAGKILIDGSDSMSINTSSWRKQIGYVSQDMVIFDDTIANNICMWSGQADNNSDLSSKIKVACKQANIDKFIESLPEKYNTKVGDRGIKLSGGQKQRLFIARELFREPNILLLDEATSALDSESESFIQDSIDNLKGSMTLVIIAHRLSTIKDVDYVYVLDQGSILESGSYDELKNIKGSHLEKLIEKQKL
jgi:ABC-type multidrug transport system fused ATPase/permease subunit